MLVSIAQGTGEGDSEMPEYGTNMARGQRPRVSSASRHGPSLGSTLEPHLSRRTPTTTNAKTEPRGFGA